MRRLLWLAFFYQQVVSRVLKRSLPISWLDDLADGSGIQQALNDEYENYVCLDTLDEENLSICHRADSATHGQETRLRVHGHAAAVVGRRRRALILLDTR